MKTFDFGYTTLEGVVERINTGAVQGFEQHTSEFLAASYAYDAAEDDKDTDTIQAHLEYLAENGAYFDESQALEIATGGLVEMNGSWVNYQAAVNLMDDDLREILHGDADLDNPQAFLDAYISAHQAKFDEDFSVS